MPDSIPANRHEVAREAKAAKALVKKAQQKRYGWGWLEEIYDNRLTDSERSAVDKAVFAEVNLTLKGVMEELGLKKPIENAVDDGSEGPLDEQRKDEHGKPREKTYSGPDLNKIREATPLVVRVIVRTAAGEMSVELPVPL